MSRAPPPSLTSRMAHACVAIPSSRDTWQAVRGWSPVDMTTRCPAATSCLEVVVSCIQQREQSAIETFAHLMVSRLRFFMGLLRMAKPAN
jgi:hypothetical protein